MNDKIKSVRDKIKQLHYRRGNKSLKIFDMYPESWTHVMN